MRFLPCSCCNNIREANAILADAERISAQLSKIAKKGRGIHFPVESRCPHFMCGTCPQFQNWRLQQAEDDIRGRLMEICQKIQKNELKNEEFYMVLRLLQGYYPLYYRTVENEWRKNAYKNKENRDRNQKI